MEHIRSTLSGTLDGISGGTHRVSENVGEGD
jgi:hypothetical protein